MNNSELNKSIKIFGEFVEGLRDSNADEEMPESGSVFTWSRENFGTLSIWGETAAQYRHCVNSIYRAVNGKGQERLSEREIERILQEISLETLDVNGQSPQTDFSKRLAQNLQNLKQRLTKDPISWDIYIGVEGFALKQSCFLFGKVRFLPGEKSTLRELRHRVYAILMRSSNDSIGKKFFCKMARQDVDEHFKGNTIAHLQVNAVDKEAAQMLAQRELTLTLDVLNFYTTFIHPRGTRVRVHLPGQTVFQKHTLALLFDNDGSGNLERGMAGPMDRFVVAALNGGQGLAVGAIRASRILAQEKHNDIEERIVAALRFAGRACVDETREQSFLSFAIAIESLLGDKNSQGEITYKLATRGAHLLGANAEKRGQIRDDLKRLYGVRSKIVHRGSLEVTDLELGQIRNYARYALVSVLTNKEFDHLSSDQQFIAWFEAKMLA